MEETQHPTGPDFRQAKDSQWLLRMAVSIVIVSFVQGLLIPLKKERYMC